MTETHSICEACRETIVPGAPGVVKAFRQVDVTGFGQQREMADGLGVLFHEECYPHGSTAYRRA